MIHGHDVLNHILAHPSPLSLDELRAWAVTTHGSEATYYTCSAQGMSFEELLIFLSQREKITIHGGRVEAFAERMCSHGGDHDHDHQH